MGALAQGLQSVGQTASDFGQAKFDYADWRQRQQASQLNNIIQTLRIQQIQNQLKQQQLPQSLGLFKGAQGEYEGVLDPGTGKTSYNLAIPGAAEWRDVKTDAEGNALGISEANPAAGYVKIPTPAGTKFQTTHAENPINELMAEGIAASKRGDDDAATKAFDLAQRATGSRRAPPAPSLFRLIQGEQQGDPAAKAQLQEYLRVQNQIAQSRGQGFGMGRAMYQIQAYYDTNGNLVPLTNFDAANMIHQGAELTPAGRLPAKEGIAVQQFQSEMGSLMKGTPAGPGRTAIPPLRDSLKAYDNPTDRLIFARVMAASGHAAYGNENAWMSNVLNQAMTEGLSPDGRQLVVSLRRLNETVGRMRSVLGLPSTDNAMQMTLALVPGPQTPDSAMAKMMIDNIEQMGQQATAIPTFNRGVAGGANSPAASVVPPPGAKIRDYTQVGP